MEDDHLKPLPIIDKVNKKFSSFKVLRNVITISLVIISLFIAVIMVITNISRITSIGLGIISIFIFWFALVNYHEKYPNCMEKLNIDKGKDNVSNSTNNK